MLFIKNIICRPIVTQDGADAYIPLRTKSKTTGSSTNSKKNTDSPKGTKALFRLSALILY